MIGEIIGSLITGAAGWFGQQETNKMQAQMQQQQMQFQERMSNTAYQRASADMQAAGLNPMMMFGHGGAASSPQGSGATPLVKSGLDADAVQKAISSAVSVAATDAQVKNLEAETAKKRAETITELQRPGLVDADVALRRSQERVSGQEEKIKQQIVPIVRNEALTAKNQEAINATARRLLDQFSFGGKKSSDTLRPVTDFLRGARDAKRAFGD